MKHKYNCINNFIKWESYECTVLANVCQLDNKPRWIWEEEILTEKKNPS